ncbi:MAG: 3-methyl-2-oxobutanoate dehydrogenase subunit VorB [Spirochaetales bacterium]|jgi:pyruvate/2-oxoacid:ferredoxin oxidoreductase alpha subunit|nr:3-methyl-2-oxobutanoate dehydrogenase subunit VorB [Spirochaetales bacterium]
MDKQLIKGNEAVVYGALLGGASHFFGYPITPASEIAHAAARFFPATGRCFLQAEDEVNSVNMLYGAASAGARVMTASSGPGISLMAEGISYIAGAELPAVIVNVQRAGPGLGNIWPEQGDYNMVVKGGGHGNYRNIVLAPFSAQEMCDFTYRSFDIAERYRMLVFILADAYIGQIMEAVALPDEVKKPVRQDWALYGDKESRENLVSSILMNTELLSTHNWKLDEKYKKVAEEMTEWEEYETEDAEYLFVAFGVCARLCVSALQGLRKMNIRAGLLRPKTLFPFPSKRLDELGKKIKSAVVVELNNGQMADDVELAMRCAVPVLRYNWMGGKVPSTQEIIDRAAKDLRG